MQMSSSISSQKREKPRIFSKPYTYNDNPSKNNCLSQPKLQLHFNQQKQIPQEVENGPLRQNRPQSLYFIDPSCESSPKNKSVQITLLKLENRKEKQEKEKMRQTVERLKKELKDKVEMLQKFNDLMKIKYAEIKTLKSDVQTTNSKITELHQQNRQLQHQRNQLQILNNEIQKQNIQLQQHYSEFKQQNNELREQNSYLVEENNKFREQNKGLSEQNNELHMQQGQLEKEVQQQIRQKLQKQCLSQQAAQEIKTLYISKSSQLDQILSKINSLEHNNFTNKIYQMKIAKLYDQLDEEKEKNTNLLIQRSELMQTINQLKEKVQLLQYENAKIKTLEKINYQSERIQSLFHQLNQIPLTYSPTKQSKQSQHLTAFQEALKVQLKQIQQLKKTIQNSHQIIQSLKDNLITSRRELEELRSQMKVMNLKETTERKKLIMEYRLQLHEKDNHINNLQKKFKTLDEKYKAALNDIKAKDDFLRQHLLGRLTDISAQQYVDSVLRKYTQNFDELIELKTQNQILSQKYQQYLKYQQEIESALMEYKKAQ